MNLRDVFTSLVNPIVWSRPGRTAKKFHAFSLAEYSAMLEVTLAANLTPSDIRAGQYLAHQQEKLKFLKVFLAHANEQRALVNERHYPFPQAGYGKLFKAMGEKRFLAYVYISSKRNAGQFGSYAGYFAGKALVPIATSFRLAREGEQRHMAYSWALLVELCGSENSARNEVAKARLREAGRSWRSEGLRLVAPLFTLIALAVYPLLIPYKLLSLLRRAPAKASGWDAVGEA